MLAPSVTNHMEAYLNAPWRGTLVGDASRGSGGPRHHWKLVALSQPRVQLGSTRCVYRVKESVPEAPQCRPSGGADRTPELFYFFFFVSIELFDVLV